MRVLYTLLALIGTTLLSGQVALHGLYTPVHLNYDTTRIIVRDYLGDLDHSTVILPEGMKNHSTNKDTLLISGSPVEKISTLEVNTAEGPKHLVLIRSSQRKVSISIKENAVGEGGIRLIGSFNNWNRESPIIKAVDGEYKATYLLNAGVYEYKVYKDSKELMDPGNPNKRSNGMGGFNNVLNIEDEDITPGKFFTAITDQGDLIVERKGPISLLVFWNNQLISQPFQKREVSVAEIDVPAQASELKRSYIRIYSYNNITQSKDLLIPLEYGVPVTDVKKLDRSDWHQARMYFLMVDRFANGKTDNDLPTPDADIHPKANYLGGDLAGVDQKVKSGFFEEMGVNTIWLSPITQNPLDAWGLWDKGEVHSKFSGYHGYWPTSNLKTDFRFGTSDELNQLLTDAHQENKNVILDYVANHVHIQHLIYQKNKDWATELYLPDGSKNTERWDEHRLTTWFDDHLPTLDLRRWEVVDPLADSALFWITAYPFDGFRHDATKHIDELYWRTLTYRIRKSTDQPIFQIGETYGSPQLINSYISTGMLDAQFDFNLYDAAVSAFANSEGSPLQLKQKLEEGLAVYGHHHLMGNITGNQDRSRFISLASGEVKFSEDQKLAGWDRSIGKPSAEAYNRLSLLHAFNNAIPGIPCIYYGDEYGMPGGGDPDNRRMMEFEDLDSDESALRKKVIELNRIRASYMPLLYGSTECQVGLSDQLIVIRRYMDEVVVAVLNTQNSPESFQIQLSDVEGFNASIIGGDGSLNKGKQDGQYQLSLPPLSYQYILLQKPKP